MSPFRIESPLSFILAPNPGFRPKKAAMEVAVTSDLKLSAFYSEATSSLDQRFHLVGLFMCCKIIFTIPHIPESQKDLCLYAGMRLKHTAFFLPL